jgi:predicted  nucleic acid-binding Zn-ribbon protein
MTKAYLLCVLVLASSAAAQAPVQGPSAREQAIQRSQIGAGAAYRELEQAQYEKKLAEQDVLNSQDAYQAAQQQAAELKRQLDAARKALDAARAKEARARKRYDEALAGVDRAFENPPAGKE